MTTDPMQPSVPEAPEPLGAARDPLPNITQNPPPTVDEVKWRRVHETSVQLDGLIVAAKGDLAKAQVNPTEAKIALQSMLVQKMSIEMLVGLAAEAIYRLGDRESLRKALGLNG
jgi:hypothetical protein